MNAVDPAPLLANVALFRELTDEQRAEIAAGARLERVARGHTLLRRGDEATAMHLVVYGQIRLSFVSPTGMEKVVDIVQAGQSFGEAAMFLEKPHVVAAQALLDSLLLAVSKEVVFERIDNDARFARRMLGGLSRRLHQLVADVESYLRRSGTERLIGFLLRDCGVYRRDVRQSAPLGRAEVAADSS